MKLFSRTNIHTQLLLIYEDSIYIYIYIYINTYTLFKRSTAHLFICYRKCRATFSGGCSKFLFLCLDSISFASQLFQSHASYDGKILISLEYVSLG